MRENLGGKQFAVMMIAAVCMTLLAAAMAVSVIGAPFVEAIFRAAVAAGSFALANYAFQAAISLREAEREALRRELVPVRVQARERRRRG